VHREEKRQERLRICDEVGRGVGQGYFADTREVVGSNPTCFIGKLAA
jgi:hypothetical protein